MEAVGGRSLQRGVINNCRKWHGSQGNRKKQRLIGIVRDVWAQKTSSVGTKEARNGGGWGGGGGSERENRNLREPSVRYPIVPCGMRGGGDDI